MFSFFLFPTVLCAKNLVKRDFFSKCFLFGSKRCANWNWQFPEWLIDALSEKIIMDCPWQLSVYSLPASFAPVHITSTVFGASWLFCLGTLTTCKLSRSWVACRILHLTPKSAAPKWINGKGAICTDNSVYRMEHSHAICHLYSN